jgi:DNA-binding transcriptional ArsR family regulator
MSSHDALDAAFYKALGHPLRLRVIEAISDKGEASPSALAREFKVPLATVSHHVRVLRDLGWIEVSHTAQRRGAIEHFYRAVRQAVVDDAQWERVPAQLRRGMTASVLRRIVTEASEAVTSGGFDDAVAHVVRMRFELDQRGRQELSEALASAQRQADEIQQRSAARAASHAESAPDAGSWELAILHFRLDEPLTPRAPERRS